MLSLCFSWVFCYKMQTIQFFLWPIASSQLLEALGGAELCPGSGETRVGSGRQVPACESGFSAVRVASEESDQSCKSQLHPGLKNSPSPPSVFLSHLPSRGACPHAAQDLHLLRCSKSLLDLVHSAPVR